MLFNKSYTPSTPSSPSPPSTDFLQDLFWHFVRKDQDLRNECERTGQPLIRHLWKSRIYPYSFINIHTFLPFYDVCALFEVLYAIERKNTSFFTSPIILRLSSQSGYDLEVWKTMMEKYFRSFGEDELVYHSPFLPTPLQTYRILDLCAIHLP